MNRRVLAATATVVALLTAIGLLIGWYTGRLFTSPTVHDAGRVGVSPSAVRTLASHLSIPWGLAFLPDGTALVTERGTARLLSVRIGGPTDATVTELARIADTVPGGEGGLLGVAVSPTYSSDQWVYVYYTAAKDNRVARLHLGNAGSPPSAPEPILTGIPKSATHNGGRIAFGPEGMLYVGTGDAGDRGKAQDRGYLGGKILRITPDGDPAPGNPFAGSPVYSYGHRNVQGLAWDSQGRLFASEFGQNRYDELNLIQPGGNYGWPLVEGMGEDKAYINPVATWTTADASPSGIAILHDRVWMACLRGKKLYWLHTDGSAAQVVLDQQYGRLRTVAVAPDGALWILTSNQDGRGSPVADDDRVLRLDPAGLA